MALTRSQTPRDRPLGSNCAMSELAREAGVLLQRPLLFGELVVGDSFGLIMAAAVIGSVCSVCFLISCWIDRATTIRMPSSTLFIVRNIY